MAKRSPKPGRPPAQQGVDRRQALLDVAGPLIAREGSDSVSLREIARAAGVTPALVAYYFTNKQGLLMALLEEISGRVLGMVDQVTQMQSASVLADFIHGYLTVIGRAPWIPQFIVREVLSRETPLQRKFIRDFSGPALARVREVVGRVGGGSQLDDELDPGLTIMSLIGISVFPFIAHPVLGRLIGYELTPQFSERYSRHVRHIMAQGVLAR
ncbi:MAG: TetR/AcrR family transcriptional regulator [Gammaproteobacteria bacterium]|nr:TetR/AcrR family transcriptional regulator [Gammaproteobacteria bacterium]